MERGSENKSLSTMIVFEVAAEEGIDPIEVSPSLHTAVDSEALEVLFSDRTTGPSRVEFPYAGHQITIIGNEIVQIEVE